MKDIPRRAQILGLKSKTRNMHTNLPFILATSELWMWNVFLPIQKLPEIQKPAKLQVFLKFCGLNPQTLLSFLNHLTIYSVFDTRSHMYLGSKSSTVSLHDDFDIRIRQTQICPVV